LKYLIAVSRLTSQKMKAATMAAPPMMLGTMIPVRVSEEGELEDGCVGVGEEDGGEVVVEGLDGVEVWVLGFRDANSVFVTAALALAPIPNFFQTQQHTNDLLLRRLRRPGSRRRTNCRRLCRNSSHPITNQRRCPNRQRQPITITSALEDGSSRNDIRSTTRFSNALRNCD
jgi:hypothetical protein